MVSMLRPLEMSVEFENKTYQLGDTIDVTVEMSPSRVVQVRGGTLNCQNAVWLAPFGE